MRQSEEPLDEAERLARELADYGDHDDEVTANVHVHLDSMHDSDPPVRKQVRAGLVALGSGAFVAALTVGATLLQRCGH